MRQSRSYGSVRGVRGNSHPYRDIAFRRAFKRGLGDRRLKAIVCPTALSTWLEDHPGANLHIARVGGHRGVLAECGIADVAVHILKCMIIEDVVHLAANL